MNQQMSTIGEIMDNLQDKWEEPYRRKENFIFYLREELVRFLSKNTRGNRA